jgi:hypothetical protein
MVLTDLSRQSRPMKGPALDVRAGVVWSPARLFSSSAFHWTSLVSCRDWAIFTSFQGHAHSYLTQSCSERFHKRQFSVQQEYLKLAFLRIIHLLVAINQFLFSLGSTLLAHWRYRPLVIFIATAERASFGPCLRGRAPGGITDGLRCWMGSMPT